MTYIRVRCNGECGVVQLTSPDIELRVCNHAPLSYYAFTCPDCGVRQLHKADDKVISLLMSGGVRAQIWDVPAEALEPRSGPPIGYDDILALHEELKSWA